MDSKIIRSSQVAFVVLVSLLLWVGCTPPAPVKPWDSNTMNQIGLKFTDTDITPNEIGGDVMLYLNNAPKPNGVDQYVLYWGGTASDSGKGDQIAAVSADLDGDLLYTIPQNTAIPTSRNRFFLLYLKGSGDQEIFSGLATAVADETMTPAEKKVAQQQEQKRIAEEKRLEAIKIAQQKRIEEEKRAEEIRQKVEEEKQKAEQARQAELATIVIDNVLFDFDRSDLKAAYKQKLQQAISQVKDLDMLKVVISGHADERGSNEYNLALGERRAYTVKRYLVSLGVLDENISVISYGEEKPVDPRHNENAWRLNRRSETDLK